MLVLFGGVKIFSRCNAKKVRFNLKRPSSSCIDASNWPRREGGRDRLGDHRHERPAFAALDLDAAFDGGPLEQEPAAVRTSDGFERTLLRATR